jgi:TRAP transporter TAXI family solute receptor
MKTVTIIITATTLLSASAALAQTPMLNFASGSAGERYNNLCEAIKIQMDRSAEVDCKQTGGSYVNAELLATGQADAGLLQANVRQVWENDSGKKLPIVVLGQTHKEVAQLACPKEFGIGDLDDLIENGKVVVAIGGDNSGHQVSWNMFVTAKPDLKKVKTRRIGGDEALLKFGEGREINCLFMTAGINGEAMKEIDRASGDAGKFALVETWDDAFLKIVDGDGKPLFSKATIEAGTYPHMQFGLFSTSYDAAAVPALLVVSEKVARENARIGRQLKTSAEAAIAQGN